ncbi:D-alanine--D-alanine ligase A [bacterium YEK0313]|nr:D-alanine--D-alanine ligase A [bacterium YEK0313]
MTRLRIAVLFGGRSAEHDVSIMSARNVVEALDADRFEVIPVFVTRDGRWLGQELAEGRLPETIAEGGAELAFLPGGRGRLLAVTGAGAPRELPAIDLIFPVLHGLHGEDGSVQGFAEVLGVPLVGCGILGSATAIDKDVTKRLLAAAGLPVARFVTVQQGETPSFETVSAALGLPLFVKPARQGSSVGVSKVTTPDGFAAALAEAFRHDRKVLVEEFVKGREIELSVLERPDGELFVSLPGEIAAADSHGFYSYDAKYIDADGAVLSVPAQLPEDDIARLQRMAREAFLSLGCDGMARVDFFLRGDGSLVVNEINTIPGFTDISMYAKALDASGIRYAQVIEALVAHGLARAERTTA